MKKTLAELIDISEKLERKIETREETYGSRSETWQESEKGEMYSDKTAELQEVYDNVSEAVVAMETYLE